MDNKAIETTDLSKVYGNGVRAVSGLDLSVPSGSIFGFLGPNGSGKTTTVRMLNGMLTPTAGSARVLGCSIEDGSLRLRIATVAENAAMYEQLSLLDNLRFFGTLYGMNHANVERRAAELCERLRLGDRAEDRLRTYSTGMRKRAHLARALLHSPSLLFLDEPTSGLDPQAAREVTDLIRELSRERDTTVFLCTHNLPLADHICDLYGFLSDGALVASGTRAELESAVEARPTLQVDMTDGSERFPLEELDKVNPIIRRLMDAGRQIREVRIARPTLEELYFHFVEGGK